MSEHVLRPDADAEQLLTEREIAALLSVTTRCLEDWRRRGVGPAYVRLGRRRLVRYRRVDLVAWITARVCGGTDRHEDAA